ncbi:DNA polymerase zeta [Recurvomyces mirabilis]|nr:DNA polymerase zeta [Recurvomyces mirabilis]
MARSTTASGDIFRVRLNCLDNYQSAPSSLDPPLWGASTHSSTQRGNLPNVPVIRVFGATETGQKVCAHVHGAFPYLYIPYTESRDAAEVERYLGTLRHSLDHALALSYRRNPYDSNPKHTTFVAHLSLVKGIPFFGYHVGYKYYIKIYLLNPMHMTRLADLLQQGAVMKRMFQPYEAHSQYLLQWMCDFNLYGCAYVEVEAGKVGWRGPVPSREEAEEEDVGHLWHDGSIGREVILDEQRFPRLSRCQLEVDIRVEDIMNRDQVMARSLHHSFIERLESLENLPPEEKLVHSMAGLWKDETRRRKKRMGIVDSGSSPFPPEVLVSMSADPRNESEGGWIHEEELRGMVDELAKEERKAMGGAGVKFEDFIRPEQMEDAVQTCLESVEELFQERMAAKWGAQSHGGDHGVESEIKGDEDSAQAFKHEHDALVDMSSIAQLPVHSDEGYDSDEEAARTRALTQKQKLEDAGIGNDMGEAKVDGDADEIEHKAEHLNEQHIPTQTIAELNRPRETKRAAPPSSRGPFKRTKLNGAEEQVQPKRNVSFRIHDVKREAPTLAPGRVPDNEGTTDVPPGSQRFAKAFSGANGMKLHPPPPSAQPPPSSQLSQRSQQSSQGSAKLHYPVVKNAHDPESQLRLSQREKLEDGPNPSQEKSGSNKQLSFSSVEVSSDGHVSSQSIKTNGTVSPAKPSAPSANPVLAVNYAQAFTFPQDADVFVFGLAAPAFAEVGQTVDPHIVYQDAYYSNEKDVPERPREYAGQEFRLESRTLPYLPAFDKFGAQSNGKATGLDKMKIGLSESRRARECRLRTWEILRSPPTYAEVQSWLKDEVNERSSDDEDGEVDGPPTASQLKRKNRPAPELSQIEGPSQKHRHGFKFSQKKASTSVQHETGYMSTMALELHVNSRGDLAPDPERDEIGFVAWCLSDEQREDDEVKTGIIVLVKDDTDPVADKMRKALGASVLVDTEETELDLINRMVDIVRSYDPDILTGYEVHNSSWGYLIDRARIVFEYNLPDEFSRMKSSSHGRFGKEADRWGFQQTSTLKITGRHTINIWRAMRSELNLLQYTCENVVFHLLHRRIPHYAFKDLTRWYRGDRPARDLVKVLEYFISRTRLDLEILDANELIPRTSEQARLLGVDFFSVFSRGSQFKVESLMFRIAKPEDFVLVSPSRKQVGAQNALECLPLVMEPQSAFYTSPVLVLDFQSLYPSVMIAYNYCYSTCLGRVTEWRGTNKLGFAGFRREEGLLGLVNDSINIAPNGIMYVRPQMRKSLLAKMLGEILETRVMVKSGMKVDKEDKTLQRLLNNRQLALKLIANVTYGYTSASFSGRMPCSEIADSIVQTGRETLEKAIALIHSVERWGAEVVYGDTDSLFIHLKGRSKDEAFVIGNEIAKAVTERNPRPVKLKFEKVYLPCVLLAKKRYVGFKYESPSQKEPEFDAKGIETVRRDGTPAEQKIEEKALKVLFRTADLSQVKRYFQQQCTRIMQGRVSVQDFCFAKEVKLGTYADRGPPPPGALIATKRMLRDPRAEPQYGERVPYVVIAGAPGARLWERCVEPEVLVRDERVELDAEYYINKNLIPPLERIFNLVGANVRSWFDEMTKVQRIRLLGAGTDVGVGKAVGKKTMESYMGSSLCLVCRTRLPPLPKQTLDAATPLPLCSTCRTAQPQRTLLALRRKVQKAEKKVKDLHDAETAKGVVVGGVGKVADAFEQEVSGDTDLEW